MEQDFRSVDRIVIGTVGLPGEREFFLQISHQGQSVSFAMEKGQAIALAERMRDLLKELRRRYKGELAASGSVAPDDEPLVSPVDAEFTIGDMSLVWIEDEQVILLEAVGVNEPRKVSIGISVPQAREFVRRTDRVVNAGRLPCPFCGLPLNIDGHLCPRANGYRR